ncbi:MAG: ChbG/HpnK family deacetylase [Candidatus Sumerlaeota bacterium]|nr:ChbG/HpnK family deacetylase [Candidatus Sumerlaeota bacterium]
MPPAIKLIINVDDLGLHPAVQRAVEDGAAAGVVTSASLMANGPFLKEALALASSEFRVPSSELQRPSSEFRVPSSENPQSAIRNPQFVVGFGAHLNLLRGKPVSPPSEIPTLVGADGLLLGNYKKLFLRYATRSLNLKEVELEWGRQIEHLLETGFTLTHVDSEKHIHSWPRLMPIALRLAERHGIRWARRVVEWTPLTRWNAGAMRARLLWFWSRFHRANPNVRWPDALWGVADHGPRFTAENFRAWLKAQRAQGMMEEMGDMGEMGTMGAMGAMGQRPNVLEICCHPGKPLPGDPPIAAEFGPLRVGYHWEVEYKSMMSGQWQKVFQEKSLQPVNYGQCS